MCASVPSQIPPENVAWPLLLCYEYAHATCAMSRIMPGPQVPLSFRILFECKMKASLRLYMCICGIILSPLLRCDADGWNE